MFYPQSEFKEQGSTPAETSKKCHHQLRDRIYDIYGYNNTELCSSMIILHCTMTIYVFERDAKR